MDLIDSLKNLSQKITKLKESVTTEEATKNAFIMPFIAALGYDVFNPNEVVPEYTADVGIKKGERIDYAILKDDCPIILIECKKVAVELLSEHSSQLYRYFATDSKIRIGVLTNGIDYQFYSDLDELHVMDKKPFFEFNLLNFPDSVANELKKFSKSSFDIDKILNTASDLKYMKDTKKVLQELWNDPKEEFVKFIAGQVYSGVRTKNFLSQFSEILKKALKEFIHDEINKRLNAVINIPADDTINEPIIVEEKPEIVTTEEELEIFYTTRAILSDIVEPTRVFIKDFKNFCNYCLDDSSQKTLVRAYFNNEKKFLGFFDENKKEQKVQINSMSDIFQHKDKLIETCKRYL
ncbi:MAG: hypothetical protein A2X64_06910 [Ignavibacteria bacterium GWF2_33_9]|nr:MAG: hypothetical protein A2X64_06910 [Ignavibacteria bacterium GWF2_33_9]